MQPSTKETSIGQNSVSKGLVCLHLGEFEFIKMPSAHEHKHRHWQEWQFYFTRDLV